MPLPTDQLIRYDRLVTPGEHLGVLVEPSASLLIEALSPAEPANLHRAVLLDRRLADWRADLRRDLDLSGPVLMTGHQAEFFHAGVLAKTIAVHALARRLGGTAAFLTVDCDLPRTVELAVPQITSRGLRRVSVRLPGVDPQLPHEHQPAVARAEWLQFFASVTSLHEFGDRSLLPVFARAWLTTDDRAPHFVSAWTRARAATEAALGLDGVRELRISHLCGTPAFRAFAATLLLDPRRCAEHYNAAQAAYRQRHRVRARGRPVPPLAVDEERVELPFWIVRPGEPRQRPFASSAGDRIRLFAEQRPIGPLDRADLAKAATHDRPWPLERDGWRLRPRALTLSAFARLFLADLFIHGIGGAKYDEITEDFIAAYFGVPPAPAGCVSATLHVPLPHSGIRPDDIAQAQHASRDLRYNPQRHLPHVPEELRRRRAELLRRSDELRIQRPGDHTARALAFRELRRLNEKILASDPWRAAEYDQRVATLQAQQAIDRIAVDREYFYALHSPESLRELVGVVRRAVGMT